MSADGLQHVYLDLLDPAVQIKVASVAEAGALTFDSEATRDAFFARAAEEVPQMLRPIRTEAEYDAIVAGMDRLLALAGEDEGHPLNHLASRLGDLVETYDEEHYMPPSAADSIRSTADMLRKVGVDLDGLRAEAEAPLVPNETTIAAIYEARAGGLPRYESVEDLMSELQASASGDDS